MYHLQSEEIDLVHAFHEDSSMYKCRYWTTFFRHLLDF